MRYVRFANILLMLLGVVAAFGGEANPWRGQYLYEADYGQNAGGIGMVVEYRLTINHAGKIPAAILQMQGYETDETIYCDVKYTSKSVSCFFKSYSDGQIKNAYGVVLYKPGQLLFTLDRPTVNGFTGLATHWHALKPDAIKLGGFRRLSPSKRY